jgi:hypothetical protein
MRHVFSVHVCALCAAVTITWLMFLVAHFLGFAVDLLLIGFLMGGSMVGGMYALEERLPARYHIFRIAFLVTLVALSYFILTGGIMIEPLVILLIVWIGSLGLFTQRNSKKFKSFTTHIINCCKNW